MSARRVPVRLVLVALIAIELVALYVLSRNNSWVYDDNFFLVLAGQEGFNWHWLSSVQFEHWDIGENALISLQHRLFFFDYRWALVFMLSLLGAAVYVFQRTLAMLVRRPMITIAFAAWFALSIIWVKPLQWWAAGVQYFPYTLFDLLCLYGFVRFHADGRKRWIAMSAAALAAALLFYEKPVFMLFYLLLFRALLMSADLRPRAVLADLWRERAVWAIYVAVIAVWAVGYIDAHAYSSHPAVHLGQYLTYFRILWLQTLVPALAGVTIPAENLSSLQIAFVVVGEIAVLACIVVSVLRKRAAWRAWAFLAIVVLTGGALVAHSRVPQFGVNIANDPRYLIDFAWLVPLALCAAFNRDDVLKPRIPEVGSSVAWRPARPLTLLLVTAGLLAYAGVTIASAAHLENEWAGAHARSWERRLRGSFARLKSSATKLVIADNATPFEIMEPFVAPYNRLSRVLGMYLGPVQVDGPIEGKLQLVSLNGTIRGASMQPIVAGASMAELVRPKEVVVTGGRTVALGGDVCVIADATPAQVVRKLSKPPKSGDAPYYLNLGYHVWRATTLPVFVDTGNQATSSTDHSILLRPTAHSSIAWLGPDAPHGVSVTIPPLTTVCLGRFAVVTVRNAS